jgi:hypothetical protein
VAASPADAFLAEKNYWQGFSTTAKVFDLNVGTARQWLQALPMLFSQKKLLAGFFNHCQSF